MDTQTRHALKTDKFAVATAGSVSWVTEHRSTLMRWVIIGVVVLAVLIGGIVFWNVQAGAAETALGAALDTYGAPLATPGTPTAPGSYASSRDRAKAANQQFLDVAHKYGWLPEGGKAHYFAGITYQELGQTGSAESELKSAAGSWDSNLSSLAKLALAGLYHQTGRDPQAIDLYNELAGKPTTTVPAGVAQLDLANLYVDEGKTDQARAIWAKVKDADKEGMAGQIASQKLSGK
ncbi:tetratricopeptide repeat protein [Acidobacteria bacterium AB60]|nr:tetratricopeptide repeat protein [Acidobacteria bacterium AB60]